MKVGTVQRDSSEFYKRFVPEDISLTKMSVKTVMAYNPVCTDQTMRKQTDLRYLFEQNPDVSGMSLLLDDSARQERLDYVQFEDFVEPKEFYDIFDVQEFVEDAKASFKALPVQFRMQYGNDPINFVRQFNDPATSSKVIDSLATALGRPVPEALKSQTAETSAPQSSSESSKKSSQSAASIPSESS